MSTTRYIISDASKKVDVEPHVLRYWEEELELDIPRNEMGHRYYKQEHIDTFKTVKALKDQGFQLKAIKMLISDLHNVNGLDTQSILKLKEELNEKTMVIEDEPRELMETTNQTTIDESNTIEDKMGQFKSIMHNLIVNALEENNETLTDNLSSDITEGVIKEMDYLLRLKEEREEERYKKIDETIRGYQKSRFEIAAGREKKDKKKKKLFHKNKYKYI